MPFVPLKRILPQAIRQAGLQDRVGAAQIVDEAQTALIRLWGADRAAHIRVISFRDGALKVAITSPSAAHAFRVIETQWVNEINRTLSGRRVLKVVVVREGF